MATFLDRIAEKFGFGDDGEPQQMTELGEWLETTLKEKLKISKIRRDEDGDIPISLGSSVLFVRQGDEEAPFVTVFAPLLVDFRMSSEVYEAVNAINRKDSDGQGDRRRRQHANRDVDRAARDEFA